MVEYEFDLSEKSITELSKKLSNNAKKLQLAKIKILSRLAEYTKMQAQQYISNSTQYSTEDLINDIHISAIVDDTISVYTNNEHALFVEYRNRNYRK